MINQLLLDYVRAQRSAGLSKEAIAQALAAGGWTANDVNEAFMALDGVKTPPPPPPSSAPTGPRVILPPPGNPPVQPPAIGGPGVAPLSPRPFVAPSEYSTAPVRRKRSGLSFMMLLLVIIVVGGGGAMIYLNPSILDGMTPYFKSFFPEVVTTEESTDTAPVELSTPTASSTNMLPPLLTATSSATTTGTTTNP